MWVTLCHVFDRLVSDVWCVNYNKSREFQIITNPLTSTMKTQPRQVKYEDKAKDPSAQVIDELQQIIKMNIMRKNNKLNPSQSFIKDILISDVIYQDTAMDDSIFESQLVIKMEVPEEKYIKRGDKMELGSILRKFPESFHRAYQAAYVELFQDMEERGDQVQKENGNDKQLLIRQFAAFMPLDKYEVQRKRFENQMEIDQNGFNGVKFSNTKKVFASGQQEMISLNCLEEATGVLDAFTISYNSLIYALQQLCGFKVRAFLVSHSEQNRRLLAAKPRQIHRAIYILLYLPDAHMIKAANKYHIKKQVDYVQIDPFLNDPMDSTNRPLRYSTVVNNFIRAERDKERLKQAKQDGQHRYQEKDGEEKASGQNLKTSQKYKNTQQFEKQVQQLSRRAQSQQVNAGHQKRKRLERKVGFILPDHIKGTVIINESKMSRSQILNYLKFNKQFQEELEALIGDDEDVNYFNDPENPDALTSYERDYLLLINRGKFNPGVEKKYVQIKKQRKYFDKLTELSKKYGYEVFEPQVLYAQFKLANKSKKFFSRLDQMLLYKEMIVGPHGELDLFNKMQKIKLSYLVLKQHIRVENLYMLNSNVYALTDQYQKFGTLAKNFIHQSNKENKQRDKSIEGGLNGHNLKKDWSKILVWMTNFNTIRNYLGQSKAFEVFIKTRMIQLFMYIAPIGVVCQIVKFIIIAPNSSTIAYYPQFYFYLAYMVLVTIIYGIFVENYRRAETNYIMNFVEQSPNVQFINEYRGPYMRDSTSDNANTYDQKFISFKDRGKTILTFVVFFLILGAEIGFYYGVRAAIVEISYKIPEYDVFNYQLFRPIQLIGYSIYFCSNAVIYNLVIVRLANWLTKFENRPTRQTYINSQNLKLFIFAIGIQMIGPIDLVFIQYSAKTSCSSDWCAKELQAYIYCRYMLILFFTLLSTADILRKYFIKIRKHNLTLENQKEGQVQFSKKLALFLQFVYEESRKDPCADIRLVDETVALIHFATFLSVFPLGPVISFLSMLIDYNLERQEILRNQQRPIAKTEGFHPYRKIIVAIGHWMLFYNFAQMFIVLEWLEYLFPNVVLAILDPPSPYGLMTLKYAIILIFMVIFEIILRITVRIVSRKHPVMDKRKWNMLSKHSMKILNSGGAIVLKEPKPIHSISRTFNLSKKDEENTDEELLDQHQEGNTLSSIKKNTPKKKMVSIKQPSKNK